MRFGPAFIPPFLLEIGSFQDRPYINYLSGLKIWFYDGCLFLSLAALARREFDAQRG